MSDGEDDFPGAPTNLEFWSLEIPAGKVVEAKIKDVPGMFEIVHITGCALGEHATQDRHVVKAIVANPEGKTREVALGTLCRDRTDQFALDFGISSTTGFRHTGRSTVYISGYLTRSYASEDEFGSDDYDMETDEDDEDEESDDEAPQAIALNANGVPKGNKAAAAEPDSEEEGESESSDDEGDEDEAEDSSDEEGEEDEDEDEEGDEYDLRLGAKSFADATASESDGEAEDESDDDEDDESDDPLDIYPSDDVAVVQYDGAAAAAGGGPTDMDVQGESSDEDEEDDDEDEDDDESDDEGEEEESSEPEELAPPRLGAAAKRPPQQPLTPQVQPKKQKGQDGAKPPPASAPAKGPQAKTAAGPAEQKFLQDIVSELRKSGGALPLGQLSTKVKRPSGVSKYKAFLLQHPDVISVDAKDNVSLAN